MIKIQRQLSQKQHRARNELKLVFLMLSADSLVNSIIFYRRNVIAYENLRSITSRFDSPQHFTSFLLMFYWDKKRARKKAREGDAIAKVTLARPYIFHTPVIVHPTGAVLLRPLLSSFLFALLLHLLDSAYCFISLIRSWKS